MRKAVILIILVMMTSAGWGFNRTIINPEDLSLKAGPTGLDEELSLVWVESYVYPKMVKEERVVSLGVRTTSRVGSVTASFGFSDDLVSLSSHDGMRWGGAYRVPDKVSAGLHAVRYTIAGDKGSIQRTVDFFVEEASVAQSDKKDTVFGEGVIDYRTWPLTVTSTCTALVGWSPRTLSAGEKITGVSKVPWYKIIFAGGEEGWVEASKVKDPRDEYYQKGFEAYSAGNYEEAIEYYNSSLALDPDFAKAYLWLAKCYHALGNDDAAYRSIKEVMRLDERDIESKVLANFLAGEFFKIAHKKFKAGQYHEAIAYFQKILDLKPSSSLSWIEMGKSYAHLGFENEARAAWREALKLEPENRELYVLLKLKYPGTRVQASVPQAPKKVKKVTLYVPGVKLPAVLADDSLEIMRAQTTRKGTPVEAALKSVITLTKSLGTPVVEKGWEARKHNNKYLVRYICEQGQGVVEAFEWLVDIDTKRVVANNDNAKVLMNRW